MEFSGYSSIVLFVLLFIGLILATFRPYWALLFVIIIYSAVDPFIANKTRTIMGEFFNLFDAMLLVALFATLVDKKGAIKIPTPVILIFSILIIGALHTLVIHKINYQLLRQFRWAVDFPLGILIGANMITDPKRVKSYLFAVIIGSLLGSVDTFFTYKSMVVVESAMDTEAPRFMFAERGLGSYLLVAAICHPFFKDRRQLIKGFWAVALIFYASAVLFGQWRAAYLAIIITPFLTALLLGNYRIYVRSIATFAVLLPVVLVLLMVVFPRINPASYFGRMAGGMETVDPGKEENVSRANQIKVEFQAWAEGNWLIGRGLSYASFLKQSERKGAAFGHIGYSQYLGTMGLIGLFIYGFYIPYIIYRASKNLYGRKDNWALVCLGILGVVTIVMATVMGFMSASYLRSGQQNVGFLFGAVWFLSQTKEAREIPETAEVNPLLNNLKAT